MLPPSCCREPRIPTTSVFSICVSSCAAASRPRCRPSCCSICCIRTAPMHERTTRRERTRCRRCSRALQVGKPSRDDLRREIANANRARAAARRLNALRIDAPRIAGVDALPLLGAFWQLEPERYAALAEAAADSLRRSPDARGTACAARRRARRFDGAARSDRSRRRGRRCGAEPVRQRRRQRRRRSFGRPVRCARRALRDASRSTRACRSRR